MAYSVSCAPLISLSSSPNHQHTYSKTNIFKHRFPTPFNPRLVFQLSQLTIQQGQGDTSKVTRSKSQAAQTDPFGPGGAAHPQHLSVHRHIHRMPQEARGEVSITILRNEVEEMTQKPEGGALFWATKNKVS